MVIHVSACEYNSLQLAEYVTLRTVVASRLWCQAAHEVPRVTYQGAAFCFRRKKFGGLTDETTTDDVPTRDRRWMVGQRTDGPNLRSREGRSIDSDTSRFYTLYLYRRLEAPQMIFMS